MPATDPSALNVAILGAGTMGHALSLVHAIGGCNVSLTDVDEETLARAKGRIAYAAGTLVEAGVLEQANAEAALERISRSRSMETAVASADLVVDAVVEVEDVKRELFLGIDRFAPPGAIIASNTSYLDVFGLIPSNRLGHSIIAHWYSPPYIIDLVDVVPHETTDPSVVAKIIELYEGFGKTVLVFEQMIPGYIANRLQSAMNLECLRLLDEGLATPQQIDLSVRKGLAGRLAILGHLAKADYTGLQMLRNGLASRRYIPPEATGSSETLDRLIAEGKTGVSAGQGFFSYSELPSEDYFRRRDLNLLRLSAAIDDIERCTAV